MGRLIIVFFFNDNFVMEQNIKGWYTLVGDLYETFTCRR